MRIQRCFISFRARLSAAPLKHALEPGPTNGVGFFPRSTERGPVEAVTLRGRGPDRAGPFRARLSAAPLKHAEIASIIRANCTFPRSTERGPVEAREKHAVTP